MIGKASALRGWTRFSHKRQYLEDHPEVAFKVIKLYDCERYHNAIEDAFERLRHPNLDP
jgi:hypothetical protein